MVNIYVNNVNSGFESYFGCGNGVKMGPVRYFNILLAVPLLYDTCNVGNSGWLLSCTVDGAAVYRFVFPWLFALMMSILRA